jgi:hypothetical protein
MGDGPPIILLQKMFVVIPDLKLSPWRGNAFSSGIELILMEDLNRIDIK